MIKNGNNTIQRRNARNFIQNEAQKRLDETVAPFDRQVLNALYVNSVDIDLYCQIFVGKPCTCNKTQVIPEMVQSGDSNVPTLDTDDVARGAKIRLKPRSLFGDNPVERQSNDVEFSVRDPMLDMLDIPEYDQREEEDETYTDSMFGDTLLCGVCYGAGSGLRTLPGYTAYGKQRHLLHVHDIKDTDGYNVERGTQPHEFRKQRLDGFVEFKVMIPRVWNECLISIRHNFQHIHMGRIYDENNVEWTSSRLRARSGQMINIRVVESVFTHVLIEFDLGLEKIKGNLSQENTTLDYQKLSTIGNITVILPPTINELYSGDVMVIRSRNLVLKVVDCTRKHTAKRRMWEWEVQTRVLQPTETLRNIRQGYKLR